MEGKDTEKPKVKQEADRGFDPVTATEEQWLAYFLNKKNFEKDFSIDISEMEEIVFPVPAQDIAEAFQERGVDAHTIQNAVNCVLKQWDQIVSVKADLREIHQFEFIVQLAGPEHVGIAQRLLTDAPQDSPLYKEGVAWAIDALGKNAPIDQLELEKLYIEQFERYGFTAIEIILARGEEDRASELFIEHAGKYHKGFDPLVFDKLVYAGLSPEAAKVWMDLSINKKPEDGSPWGHEGHYKEALKRWESYRLERKTRIYFIYDNNHPGNTCRNGHSIYYRCDLVYTNIWKVVGQDPRT